MTSSKNRYYTNVFTQGDVINHFYVENGVRKTEKVHFKPQIGLTTPKNTGKKNIFGENVGMIDFESIRDMADWIRQNGKHVEIYDNISPVNQFLVRRYSQEIVQPDFTKMVVANIDIEVISSDGAFPEPEQANYPVTSITISDMYRETYKVYGYKDYTPKSSNIEYFKCEDEEWLLRLFVDDWYKMRPDIVTGWNTTNFDIPYLIHRMKKVLHKNEYKKMSPVNNVRAKKERDDYGKETTTYNLVGIQDLDYMRLYKKFNMSPRESFSLNAISAVELSQEKIAFHDEYDGFADLYNRNPDKFFTYNVRDVQLVGDLNKKMKYIELIMTMCFTAGAPIYQGFGTVGIWESLLYKELNKRQMVIHPKKDSVKEEFPGGFVKQPTPGMLKWLTVWDITSSYPSTIIGFNISPETLIDIPEDELVELLDHYKHQDDYLSHDNDGRAKDILKKHSATLSANGEFFSTKKNGIFPTIVKDIFGKRVAAKKRAKILYGEIEELKKNGELAKLEEKEMEYAAEDGIQYSMKIFLNSFYGCFSSEYFRYYDIKLASAVTMNAQLAIKGPAKYLEETLPKLSLEYIDTDSIFLSTDKIINERFEGKNPTINEKRSFVHTLNKKIIGPKIADFYQKYSENYNLYENPYEMDCEVIADNSLFLAKKKYIMNLVHKDGYDLDEPDLKIRGVEIVRTSTPQVCRTKLKDLVKLIIRSNDNDKCIDFIEEFKKEFFNMEFHEVAFPRGVNHLGKYKNATKRIPIHVRASFNYNNALKKLKLITYQKITEGNKIKFAYIKEPSTLCDGVMASNGKLPEEFKDEVKIDYEIQFKKAFVAPAQSMFNALSWQTERISSLDDWF